MRTSHPVSVGIVALASLDLSKVKMKIMEQPPEGKGWSQAQADEAEVWYRRFLELGLRHPDFPVVPNYPIDMIWHQHILDTRAYAEDCDKIFGEMLHHYPYFGLMGDAQERDTSFDETNALYRKYFGVDCTSMTEFNRPPLPEGDPIPPIIGEAVACTTTGGGGTCYGSSEHTEANNIEVVAARCGKGPSPSNCQGSGTSCHAPRRFDFGHEVGHSLSPRGYEMVASGCGGKGSGTGCGQRGCRGGSK